MIRLVFEHSPELYSMCGHDEAIDGPIPQTCTVNGDTFYRVESTPRWILFRQAVKGHGERNAGGGRHTLHEDQQ